MAIEIVDIAIKNGVSFHSYVTNYQRVDALCVQRSFHRTSHICQWDAFREVPRDFFELGPVGAWGPQFIVKHIIIYSI